MLVELTNSGYEPMNPEEFFAEADGTLILSTEKQGNFSMFIKFSTKSGLVPLYMPLLVNIGPSNLPRFNMAPFFDKTPVS